MEIINYNGIYKDDNQELPITIENDFSNLTAIINGIKFTSFDMDTWMLDDSYEYDEEQLDSLAVSSETTRDAFNLVTKYMLQDCTLTFNIPQRVLNKHPLQEEIKDLIISVHIGDGKNRIDIAIQLDDKLVELKDIEQVGMGLTKLNEIIRKSLLLFNCHTCRFSSYSTYGRDTFGSLLCYKRNKDRFLKVTSKETYQTIQNMGYDTVQEIYYCDSFQLTTLDQFIYK